MSRFSSDGYPRCPGPLLRDNAWHTRGQYPTPGTGGREVSLVTSGQASSALHFRQKGYILWGRMIMCTLWFQLEDMFQLIGTP